MKCDTKDKIHVLGKSLTLYQLLEGFRTSIDAVLLASACPAKKEETALDMGCGVGTAGLCLVKRTGADLTGIDIQKDHVELAQKNASLNEFDCKFLHVDIRNFESKRFHHIICNPPYLEAGTHTKSPSKSKATAKGDATLKDWLTAAHKHLKSKGSFTLIHRADYTDKIIREMGKRFGKIEIIPLWPKEGVAAKRVIIRCVKDSQSPCILHPGLVLHEGQTYTQEAEKILRGRAALL